MNYFESTKYLWIYLMEIYKIYESLITEAEIEACVRNFGYELFGDELGGKERNTGLEMGYADEINAFTDNMYGEETKSGLFKAIKTLKGCMGQYPEILIPEKTKVYRGLTLPVGYFINNKIPISLTEPMPYIYKARNPIQSWTSNLEIASTFGNHEIVNEIASKINFENYQTPEARQKLLRDVVEGDLRMAFILEYTTNPKEFIFKSKYFKVLSAAHHEDELLRMDNKPIKVIAKFNDSDHLFITGRGTALIKYINKAIEESKLFTKPE